MQEMNEKTKTWRESFSLNIEKSKRLFTLTDEIEKMKAIGKKIIKVGRTGLASSQKDEAVQHAKFMLKEADSVAKQAKTFHLLDATPEVVQQLDIVIEEVKNLRIETEDISRTMI